MKLDRNANKYGHGKYALVNMRSMRRFLESEKANHSVSTPEGDAFRLLIQRRIISLGREHVLQRLNALERDRDGMESRLKTLESKWRTTTYAHCRDCGLPTAVDSHHTVQKCVCGYRFKFGDFRTLATE